MIIIGVVAVVSDQFEPVYTRTMTLSLCRAELTPLSKSNGAVELEIFAVVEVAFQIKVVVKRRVNSGEFLQAFHLPKPQHRPFSSSKRLVRILASIVPLAAGFLLLRIAYDFHGSTVGSKFVRHDEMWAPIAFHCFPEEFQRGFAISALRNKGFQNFTLMIHGTPKIVRLTVDLHENFV